MKKGLIAAAILVAVSGVAQAAFVPMCDSGNQAQAGQNKFVSIGAPDNDKRPSGYGSVGYKYEISKYEVTIKQFARSGAGDGDENFWQSRVGRKAPAVNVSLYEAMKYCNWKTSGDVDSGVYQFDGDTYVETDRIAAILTYGTVYALPTFDEWYKAAYYNVEEGLWSLYANGTDTSPTHSESRYGTCSPWAAVGSGEREQNGTYDMMGNVYEWTEMVAELEGLAPLCGGAYDKPVFGLSSSNCLSKIPETEGICVGFRIVRLDAEAIPEPATALLFGIGGMGAWLSRRNRLKAKEESVA